MIIPLSGGPANGGGVDSGGLPMAIGDGIHLVGDGFDVDYKIYSNGIARLVDNQYVLKTQKITWEFSTHQVVDL